MDPNIQNNQSQLNPPVPGQQPSGGVTSVPVNPPAMNLMASDPGSVAQAASPVAANPLAPPPVYEPPASEFNDSVAKPDSINSILQQVSQSAEAPSPAAAAPAEEPAPAAPAAATPEAAVVAGAEPATEAGFTSNLHPEVIEKKEWWQQGSGDQPPKDGSPKRGGGWFRKPIFLGLVALALVGGVVASFALRSPKSANPTSNAKTASDYTVTSIPLSDLAKGENLTIDAGRQLAVNGQLRINDSAVISPSERPQTAVQGQLYFDKNLNQLMYYNGTQYVPLGTTIGGSAGTIAVGQGINLVNSTINNTGVISIQGQTGAVNFSSGGGIAINGSTITNTGVLGIGGTPGQIQVTSNNGNVQLSLPNLVASSVIGTDSSGNLTSLTPSSNGLCLISTPSGPQFGSCTGTSTVTSITPSGSGGPVTGAITISAGSGLSVTSNGTDTITIASTGGTGVLSLNGASGTLIVDDATVTGVSSNHITINKASSSQFGLVKVDGASVIINGSGLLTTAQDIRSTASPIFAALTLTAPLSVASGGTGLNNSSAANGNLLIGNGTGFALGNITSTGGTVTVNNNSGNINLEVGGLNQCSGCANQALSNLSATTAISQTLLPGTAGAVNLGSTAKPFGNLVLGASAANTVSFNLTNLSGAEILTVPNTSGTLAVSASGPLNLDPTSGNLSLTGTVAVGNGGTGSTSLTAHGVLIGNGTSALNVVAETSTSNLCLLSQSGGDPIFSACPAGGDVSATGTHTAGHIALFDGSGTDITNSVLSQSSSDLTAAGTLTVVSASGTAFNVQDASNTDILSVDTSGKRVFVNQSATSITDVAFQVKGPVQITPDAVPPVVDASHNGTIFWDPNGGGPGVGKFKIIEGGSAKVLCNTTDQGCGAGTNQITLQGAYDNGDGTITTNSGDPLNPGLTKNIGFNLDATTNSSFLVNILSGATGRFAVQNAGTDMFAINSTAATLGVPLSITSSSALTLGKAGPAGNDGAIVFKNASNSNTVTLKSGTTTTVGGYTLKLPTAAPGSSSCLMSDNTGQLSFATCLTGGGGGGGVTFLNGLSGAVDITSLDGSITIDSTSSAGKIDLSVAGAGTCLSCANADLGNLTATSINQSLNPVSSGLDLGSNSQAWQYLYLGSGANSIKLQSVATTARNLTFDDLAGHIVVTQSSTTPTIQSGNIGATGVYTSTVGSTSGNLTLDSASNIIQLASDETTLQRVAAGTYTVDLKDDSANTTLAIINSGTKVANVTVDGDFTASGKVNGLTQSASAITATGALNITSGGSNALTLTPGNGTLNLAGTTIQGNNALTINAGGTNQNLTLSGTGTGKVIATGTLEVSGGSQTLDVTSTTLTGSSSLTITSAASSDITINTGSGTLNTNASTIKRAASGTTTINLLDSGADTTLAVTNSDGVRKANLSVEGTINGLTLNSSNLLATGGLNIGTSGSGDITLAPATGTLILSASTWQRAASGTTAVDLNNASDTTFAILNTAVGAVANLTVEGTINGLTQSATAITAANALNIFTGNSNDLTLTPASGTLNLVGGTLQGNGALTVSAGGTNKDLTLKGTGTGKVAVTGNFQVGGNILQPTFANANGRTYVFDATDTTGTVATICTTIGNCIGGSGGGVGSTGTTKHIAVFGADGFHLVDSILSQDSYTSPTTLTLAGDFLPDTANSRTLGSAALPFKNLYLGAAANKSVNFDLSALTTNRTITIPDASGTVALQGTLTTNTLTKYDSTTKTLINSLLTDNGTNFDINSGKFTVVEGTGDTTIAGTLGVTAAITGQSTIQGTSVNGTTGINTGAAGGTQRIDSSGNLVSIGSITASSNSTSTITSGGTTTNGLNIIGSQTTGTALALTANSLTTGSGLSVSSTSPSLVSGSLISANHTGTYTTQVADNSNLLSLSRSLTANETGSNNITFDSKSFGSGNTASLSWAHTVGSFTNRALVVTISSAVGVTGVTYNGAAMTSVGTVTNGSVTSTMYAMANPAIGTHNVVVSLSSGNHVAAIASSWYNVDQTTPVGTAATNTASSTSVSASVASTTTSDVVVSSFAETSSGSSIACGGGSTDIYLGVTGFTRQESSSYKAGASGSTSISGCTSFSDTLALVAAPLKAYGGSPTLGISGALASLSSSCSVTAGACSDSSNILNLNQQYGSATGAVLAIQNSGTGADIQLATGNIQTAGGTTTTGVNLQSGTATAGSSGAAILQSGGGTTGTGNVSVLSGNASAGTSGTLTVSTGTGTTGTGALTVQTGNASAAGSGALSVKTGTGTSTTGSITIASGNVTGSSASGAISIDTGTTSAGTTGGAISIGTGSCGASCVTKSLTFGNLTNSTDLFQLKNSTTAYQVQATQTIANVAGTQTLFNIDTTNSNININNNFGDNQAWANTGSPATTDCRQGHTSVAANGFIYQIAGSIPANCGTPNASSYPSRATDSYSYARMNVDGTIASSGTGSWSTVSSNPLPGKRYMASSVVSNGFVYVLGGIDETSTVKKKVYYARLNSDGTLGTWQTNSVDMPTALYGHSSVVANGYLYIIGGTPDGSTATSVVSYGKINADGSISSWSTANSINSGTTRAFHSSAVVNGYIYVIGGCSDGANATCASPQSTVYMAKANADGTLGSWNSGQALGVTDYGHSTVSMNGYLYAIGGTQGSGSNNTFVARENSDGTLGAWAPTQNQLQTNFKVKRAAFVGYNGYIYLTGGFTDATTVNYVVQYASTSRVKIAGSLDLVGQGGIDNVDGGGGGSLTAGDTNIVGTLAVRGQANFAQAVAINGPTTISADALTAGSALNISQTGTIGSSVTLANNLANISRNPTVNAAAITQDGSPVATSGATNPVATNFTISSANEVLVVTFMSTQGGASNCALVGTFGTIKYGGVNATGSAANANYFDGSTGWCASIFYWVNPPVGTASISVSNAGNYDVVIGASAWKNVSQTTPFSHSNTNTAATSITTTSSAGEVVIDAHVANGASVGAPGAGQTTIANTTSSVMRGRASYKSASAGSTTTSWTTGAASEAYAAATLAPAGAVSVTGALASLSSNCTVVLGSCSDTSNILNLNQQYSSATGSVLAIQNSGTGADIQLGSGLIQTAAGTTSVGVTVQSGTATAGASGAAILQSGGGTTGTGALSLLTGNASAGGSGAVSLQSGTGTTSTGALTVKSGNASAGTSGTLTVSTGTGTTGTGAISIITGNASAGNSGALSLDVGTASGTAGTINIGTTNNAASINIGKSSSSTNVATNIYGSAVVKSTATANSSTAFQVQRQNGNYVLNVDTAASQLAIRVGTSSLGQYVLTDEVSGGGVGLVFKNNNPSGVKYSYVSQEDNSTGGLAFCGTYTGPLSQAYCEAGKEHVRIDPGGATTFRNDTDSSAAFKIQNAAGSTGLKFNALNLDVTYNSADATLYVGKNTNGGSNRSINAAGSVNINGADYAEYIPWSGPKPQTGSIVDYNGSSFIVSSTMTAAFVGNDKFSDSDSLLVTFAGQVPVRVSGDVAVGDILVNNGDGTAKAVHAADATVGQLLSKLAIAQESASGAGVHSVTASVGTTSNTIADALQQASSSYVDLTVTGTLTVASVHVTGDITVGGHIVTAGGQPTTTTEAGAGSGATATISGNDTSGVLTIVTGDAPASGDLVMVAFTKAFGTKPRVVLTPNNNSATTIQYFYDSDTDSFKLKANNAPAAHTTYQYSYFVVQ